MPKRGGSAKKTNQGSSRGSEAESAIDIDENAVNDHDNPFYHDRNTLGWSEAQLRAEIKRLQEKGAAHCLRPLVGIAKVNPKQRLSFNGTDGEWIIMVLSGLRK